jgi:PAS domain S-box-containing protein
MKRAKKNIKKVISEKSFRALIENAKEGIVLYDTKGVVLYAAPSVKHVTGYTATQLLRKDGASFVHPDDIKEAQKKFKSVAKRPGKSVTIVQRLKHKQGHYYWAEAILTNFTNVPHINGIVSNFRDITEKKEAEEKEKHTQYLLQTISANLSEGVYIGIIGKKYLLVNDAFLKILGYTSLADLNKVKPASLYADDVHRQQIVNELLKNEQIRNVEALFIRKNGEKFWGILNATLVKEKGKDDYYVGTVCDISKDKDAEQQLIESHNFLNTVIKTVAAPIFVKDEKHRWVMFNDPFCNLIGKTRKEILGKTDKDFLAKEEAKVFWRTDNEVLKTGKTIINEETITNNGVQHHLMTVKSRNINEKGEKFIIGFITDITAFKKVEREINQLNANLQGVMESTNESIFAVDKNYCYTSFNANHKRIMKLFYNADIEVGINKLHCIKNSADERWLNADLKRAMRGHHFVVQREVEYDGYSGTHIQLTYNPIHGDKNEIEGVAVFVSDISERKIYETKLKSLNEELTQQNFQLAAQEEELKAAMEELSERNFELDQLMYKTSHDLRSPLSSIMGLINLAHLDDSGVNHKLYLEKIEGRINKLDEFIRSMLNYARANRSDISISKIDLKKVAELCIHELEYLDNFKAVKTDISIDDKGLSFKSDSVRINIIFGNIISNAYKYYNAEAESFLEIKIIVTPLLASIEFIDNGIGIREEYQGRIFNMFFRATERSQGSGLGMYIVKQAIEKLDGTISLTSEYGKGSSIKITVPNL